jgi:hypothetical protein
MVITQAGARIPRESVLAYAMFNEYVETRDLHTAYEQFMAKNLTAQTSFKSFVRTAHEKRWQERINEIDAEHEVATVRETRRAGLSNNLTAEMLAAELYTTLGEEFRLHQSELTHKDIIKYMEICGKIGDRWAKCDAPTSAVTVNVSQNVEQTVDVPEDVLREIGKKLASERAGTE